MLRKDAHICHVQNIIFQDADIDQAVDWSVWGIHMNYGQTCKCTDYSNRCLRNDADITRSCKAMPEQEYTSTRTFMTSS